VTRSLAAAVALAAAAAVTLAPQPAAIAQPASALGQWLPAADLPPGTVTVRVVAGDPSIAAPGVDVTLSIDSTSQTVRTNAEGRAAFSNLAVGAVVQARTPGAQGEVVSEPFTIPASGGGRVMLSTKPLPTHPAAGGAGGMGGPGGMPNPRQVSGQPRPEAQDPPGTLTIRLLFDSFSAPSPDYPVLLVGYKDDDSVTVQRVRTDASGRAVFKDLDVSGRTAYYAMTLLLRDGAVDRLISAPIQMLPGLGMRMILSGLAKDSKEGSIDDYKSLETQLPNVPAGAVTVAVVTERHDEGGTIELCDAATGKVLATEKLPPAQEATASSEGRFGPFEPDTRVPPGTLRIVALGGPQAGPLVGARVALAPATPGVEAPATAVTDENGRAVLTGIAPGTYTVMMSTDDRDVQSDPIEIPADTGGRVVGAMQWFEGIPPRMIPIRSIPATPEPLYIQLKTAGGVVRKGLPFMPAPDHGHTSVFELGDRLRFGFGLTGSVDDKYYAVNGQFTLINNWWSPYRAGEDGLVIPLPANFVGAILADEDKQRVTPEPYSGFRIRRPLPPGPYQFQGGFSLPIDTDGAAQWDLDLPWGAFSSNVNLIESPGMKVELPGGARGLSQTSRTGTKFYAVSDIDIAAGQRMSMVIRGLPVAPAWKTWLPRFAGLAVLVLLVFTVWLAVKARGTGTGTRAAADARIQALMDELVEIEKQGQGGKRKEALLAELEQLWEADERRARPA
jgi:hypothetical protein